MTIRVSQMTSLQSIRDLAARRCTDCGGQLEQHPDDTRDLGYPVWYCPTCDDDSECADCGMPQDGNPMRTPVGLSGCPTCGWCE